MARPHTPIPTVCRSASRHRADRLKNPAPRLIRFFCLVLGLSAAIAGGAHADTVPETLIGKVVFMRHALAPGNGDPNNFDINDCTTQRNLNEDGRQQARLTGQKLKALGIAFETIYTSEWCRCRETAKMLAVGKAVPLRALNSFYDHYFSRDELLPLLEEKLSQVRPGDPPILMVTHFVTIMGITGKSVSSGDLVVYDPATGESEMLRL